MSSTEGFREIFGSEFDIIVQEIKKDHKKYLEGIGI
jgi:hypothetical protein